MQKSFDVSIQRKKHVDFKSADLAWNDKARAEMVMRILNLRDDQLGALAHILCGFLLKDLKTVVAEIRDQRENSIHIAILLTESDSKELINRWVDYFKGAR